MGASTSTTQPTTVSIQLLLPLITFMPATTSKALVSPGLTSGPWRQQWPFPLLSGTPTKIATTELNVHLITALGRKFLWIFPGALTLQKSQLQNVSVVDKLNGTTYFSQRKNSQQSLSWLNFPYYYNFPNYSKIATLPKMWKYDFSWFNLWSFSLFTKVPEQLDNFRPILT